MYQTLLLGGFMLAGLAGCLEDSSEQSHQLTVTWDFAVDADGWTGDFADYPVGEASDYELIFEHTMLPSPLDIAEGALILSGMNMSDDLFMFIKTKVSGLKPRTTYRANFTVEFASDVPDNQAGVGGSPGESVWIKAGATTVEPVPQEDEMGYYRMNIDKGGQSQGGSDMVVLGDFSNDTDREVYTLITVNNDLPFMVTTDSIGGLWVIAGTDSGFEATTKIFYNTVRVSFVQK